MWWCSDSDGSSGDDIGGGGRRLTYTHTGLIIEALSRLITNDNNIEGVKVQNTHHKISQYGLYADDSTLIGNPPR